MSTRTRGLLGEGKYREEYDDEEPEVPEDKSGDRHSTAGELRVQAKVNLERSLRVGDRLGKR